MKALGNLRLRVAFVLAMGSMGAACSNAEVSENTEQGALSQVAADVVLCECAPSSPQTQCAPGGATSGIQAQAPVQFSSTLPVLAAQQIPQVLPQGTLPREAVVFVPGQEQKAFEKGVVVRVNARELDGFRSTFREGMLCKASTARVDVNPLGPRAGTKPQTGSPNKTVDSSSLPKCSAIARQAVWNSGYAAKNYCVEETALTATDSKSPWFGKSGAALEAVERNIESAQFKIPFGGKSSGNRYACQCQRNEGCILYAPVPLAKGQSMFMDDYGAFFFEHKYDGRWGFCKKHL